MTLEGGTLFGCKGFLLGEDPKETSVEVRLITWGDEGKRRIFASSPPHLVSFFFIFKFSFSELLSLSMTLETRLYDYLAFWFGR